MSSRPPSADLVIEGLRDTALRLTAELDEVRLYQAAAYVAMAADAMARSPDPAVNDNAPRSDVVCEFELDENGRVWMRLEAIITSSAARKLCRKRCGGSCASCCRGWGSIGVRSA